MIMPDGAGYDDYKRRLSAEGVAFEDMPLNDTTAPGGALPDKRTTDRLRELVTRELAASESSRREHMENVTAAWLAHDLTPYGPDQMILPEMESVRVPLIRSRVDQAHTSMYSALAVRPFVKAEVADGQDGTVALHAEQAIGEELDRGEFENELDKALRGSLVGTCGFLKVIPLEDEDEPGEYRIDVESVDIREMYLSPHEVRNLEQCTLIAHRYKTETYGWAWDNALAGVFDRDAVKKIRSAGATLDVFDGGGTERAAHGLDSARSGNTDDSRQLDLVEAYVRFRADEDSPREWWRVYVEWTSKTVLRAEPWPDGQPFKPIRHQRGQTTMYAPSFANVLRDMQWASDMLLSASIEADRMGISPTWKVNVMSPAMEWLKRRQEASGAAVRPLPGDVIPTRGNQDNDIVPMYHTPTPPQIDARMNRLEQLANVATIPVTPMQTYRSATEHRYAQASVSGKEQQMLKVLRADLAQFLEYYKRLYWKYRATPITEDLKQVVYGTLARQTTAQQWGTLRFLPRGMTTAADQMLMMQTSQEVMALVLQVMTQKPMLQQAGLWEQAWSALRLRLDTLGVEDWERYIGPNPVQDPDLIELDPYIAQRKQQAAMMLMQANMGMGGGGMQPGPQQGLPGVQGDQGRASDGAPTVPPGGAPMGGVN